MEKKNIIKIVISIVCTLILLIGTTYAAWNFLTEKTDIVMTVGGDQISFNAGSNITVNNILPVYTMEEGITKDIEIYKANGDYTAGINLYLNLTKWDSVMGSNSFRWALYKNGSYLSSGDFAGKTQGNVIKLTANTQKINLIEDKDDYKLYLWIDAYQESNINMMNKSFTVTLYGEVTFYDDEDPIADDKQPNAPELADGMIPIKYNYVLDEWVKADSDNTDNDWYDYYNKTWANAVMVTSDTRSMYMNASEGTTINEDDILAYYVWIPRYRYVLFNTGFETISPREIQIEFQSTSDEVSLGTQNDDYLTHPAFWWDLDDDGQRESNEEISGFWVGKFETSGTLSNPTIKPNMNAANGILIYNSFLMNKKFETSAYLTEAGTTEVDSHMMKNMEWGAVAYLSHSKYGKNGEILINNNKSFITGRRGNYTYNDFVVTDGNITINKEAGTGVQASTTGNVYGVYDMSGSAYEYVMAMQLNASGTLFYNNSGFNDTNIAAYTDITDGIYYSKYYDLYEFGTSNSDYSRSKLGDATGETLGWYMDYKIFINSSGGFFFRGGHYGDGQYGGIFSFYSNAGSANAYYGTRAALVLS